MARLSLIETSICGCITGGIMSPIRSVTELIKIQLQMDLKNPNTKQRKYHGSYDVFKIAYRNHMLFRGFKITFLCESIAWANHFLVDL